MNDQESSLESAAFLSSPPGLPTSSVPLVPVEKKQMGVFSVRLRLANWQNQFLPLEEQGETIECDAIVDSGASDLAIPSEMVERLRLQAFETVRVFTADGARHEYPLVGIIECQVGDRRCRVQAIELPRGSQPLLGAVPLEQMDLHISSREKRLMPNPASPDKPLLPLC